jgi:NAD(P)H dehydrogenase (quinone)
MGFRAMPEHLMAVTGATGAVGTRVATRVAERGARQRLVVRDPTRAPKLPGAEVRAASGYGDAEGMRAALEGAHTVFLIPATESPDRVEQHVTAVDSVLAAGVERLVYLSFLGASPDARFSFVRDHFATERHASASCAITSRPSGTFAA